MSDRQKVLDKLDELGIEYDIIDHPAVFTVEDGDKLNIARYGDICKNLFLKDAKGLRYFLVVLDKDKKIDLKDLQGQLNSSRLSFAPEEILNSLLHLSKGEVTPLAVMNDTEHLIEVVLDRGLEGKDRLGFHPNINTATLWISFEDLKKFIQRNGNKIHFK
ncbi:MAG: prolyl-tRNA synthetase associated domain-containing protein [Bacillota bacterium]|nr:prolyl-tRNA synthetase associated domain-containing protein [Bacillota bacterium]